MHITDNNNDNNNGDSNSSFRNSNGNIHNNHQHQQEAAQWQLQQQQLQQCQDFLRLYSPKPRAFSAVESRGPDGRHHTSGGASRHAAAWQNLHEIFRIWGFWTEGFDVIHGEVDDDPTSSRCCWRFGSRVRELLISNQAR